jgi:putative membrane protein
MVTATSAMSIAWRLGRPELAGAILALGLACSAPHMLASSGGPLTNHMAVHFLLMNVAAPLLALSTRRRNSPTVDRGARGLASATFLQIAALWGWHLPSVLQQALSDATLHLTMQLSLFAVAWMFWFAVLSQRKVDFWRAILSLLVTSKLYCLLGVLLIFASSDLYPGTDIAHRYDPGDLDDQQTAGLIMLAACPLTFVLGGVIMAAQWVQQIVDHDRSAGGFRASDQGG